MPKIKNLLLSQNEYESCLINKNSASLIQEFKKGLILFSQWKDCLHEVENLKSNVNNLSAEFKKTKEKRLISESKKLKQEIQQKEVLVRELDEKIKNIELKLPNWFSNDVPLGNKESDAKILEIYGIPNVWKEYELDFKQDNPKIEYYLVEYQPFHHYDLITNGLVDQEKAGEIASTRFYYEFDEIVILDLAISMYAMEFFRNKGYADKIMIPPYLMRKSIEKKITYFETFEDTVFEVTKDELLLTPSSEHSIVAYYDNKIFKEEELPLRITAWSPAFRREAGSHGKDTRGIFRVKQFHKVELHSIVKKDEDIFEIERMKNDVHEFLNSLELPHRSVIVASGDMDKRAIKQIDMEVWMPGQGKYRETHSIASVDTWISEKLLIRYNNTEKKKELVRNVYGTAAAIQRMICAIVENHYDFKTNTINIPSVLKKYMMGIDKIKLEKS